MNTNHVQDLRAELIGLGLLRPGNPDGAPTRTKPKAGANR